MTVRIGGTVVAQSRYRVLIKMEEKMMEERNRMKILIAYDGSECAESAIVDLKRAGLPRRAEAIVLTIAEELFPAPTSIGGVATTFGKDLLEKEKDSLALARRAQSRIHQLFPGWKILVDAGIGSPGSEIIARADEWRPDLIVVGSHGRTALGRMFFGSVSQKVINEAWCTVRVARGRIGEPDVPARIQLRVGELSNLTCRRASSSAWTDPKRLMRQLTRSLHETGRMAARSGSSIRRGQFPRRAIRERLLTWKSGSREKPSG